MFILITQLNSMRGQKNNHVWMTGTVATGIVLMIISGNRIFIHRKIYLTMGQVYVHVLIKILFLRISIIIMLMLHN